MPGEDIDDALDESTALQSVGHGAVVSIAGVSLQKAFLFLTNLILTTGLGVGIYGVYAFGWRITRLLLRFAPFGTPSTLVRMLPEFRNEPTKQNRILGLAYVTTFTTTLTISVLVFLQAEQINDMTISHPSFPLALKLFALLLPFDVFIRVLGFLFRALELIEYHVLITRVLRPGLRLAAIAVAISLGYSLGGVVTWIVIAAAIVLIFAIWLSRTRTEIVPVPSVNTKEAASFYNYSLPNTFRTVGQLFRSRVDVILIGWLLTAEAAGIYNIALFLTSIITIPLIAFNQLFPPIASKFYTEGEHEKLSSMYSTVTRLIFTVTIVIAVTQFVYRKQILALFGPGYTEGALVLGVFVVGRVIGNSVGATGWLLLMTDHQYLRLVDSWLLAVLNIASSYYLILEYGLVGAALGTAGSLAVVNVLRVVQLWYLEGLQPITVTFGKPLVAGVGMAILMTALKPVMSGPALLIVGTSTGLTIFLSLLYLFGIEKADRVLMDTLYNQYRSVSLFR
jgi:O-antigen/teichoic acid export membrane protein